MALEGLFALIVIGWIVTAVGVGAHASGQNKTPLWGAAVFVFGIFGLLFYAISLGSD